ncbi:MAG: ribosome recycling factor [Lachnospiraceae bacterium]|nr:ribosome recycling factor [Lachnospiraceae bacterium]
MDKRLDEFKDKMQKSYESLLKDYAAIRAGRANPHILDKITVDYYGAPTPLQQVANINVPEARMIQITPWEASLLKDIEKAILCSDVGINPTNDGKSIRLVFPDLTEDRRKELSKEVKKMGEAGKVAVRNVRRDANDFVKKTGKEEDLSEDETKDLTDQIQKLTDEFIAKIDQAIDDKTKEVMTV